MLLHMSFNAADPEDAARTLAAMLAATPVRAPTPPFPAGSWFVCAGDARGSYLEIIPWGHVFQPEAPFSLGRDPAMRPHGGAHVLCATPLPAPWVHALAARKGWRSEVVDTGLFRILKVWTGDGFLVEMLPPEFAADYRAVFDARGLPELDAVLRRLETALAAQLAARAGAAGADPA
ncbi:hypothetical protein [Inquilinus limosus]|uniref:VOC domain-containing protein n=1 Tax=Inquilinus limosus TaxID=171674 RepID=A0A211ZND6_9PROT|nr:hypothetical protein [Inquilinus limosus]OWJ66760.1 hypothetical protein BWR60_12585 [Inquilinus limosus]